MKKSERARERERERVKDKALAKLSARQETERNFDDNLR